MPFITCQSMRATVVLAAILFLSGLICQAPPLFFQESTIFPLVLLSFLGLAAMALGMVILLLTALLALLPSVSKRLDTCQH